MKFDSAFNPGDQGWVFDGAHVRQRTIGQICIKHVQSDGIGGALMEGSVVTNDGENYAPMPPSTIEEYMCVETGIGSGTVYTLGKHIFTTEEACRIACAAEIRRRAKDDAARAKWERDQMLSEEAPLRLKLARIEALKAEATA